MTEGIFEGSILVLSGRGDIKLKIIHLEDSVIKHIAISRVVEKAAQVDWVTDMASGIEKIDYAIEKGIPYDLAITDMHYPLLPGIKADWEAGNLFVDIANQKYDNLPVIICSTHNMKNTKAYGCVWFNDLNDWENELKALIVQCDFIEKICVKD